VTSPRRLCEYPAVVPSRENPAGDCRATATRAVRRGDGRPMPLCPSHAEQYPPGATFPVEEVEDP
jgi:hypothetical protein